MAWSPDHSSRWSRKSTMPASAHCRSSMTMHYGEVLRQPLEEESPAREELLSGQNLWLRQAEQLAEPGGDELAVGGIGDPALEPGAQPLGGDLLRVLLADPQPRPDHLRERPVAHPLAVGEAPPRVPQHLAGETVDVLEELPAQAGTFRRRRLRRRATSRAERRSAVAWKSSLTRRSSRSRPMNGRLEDPGALRAGDAGHDPGGLIEPDAARPCPSARARRRRSYAIAAAVAARVVSST